MIIERMERLKPYLDRFDAFIIDLWGVVHNGQEPYPGVIDTLAQLKAMGKRLVMLSNAPREWDQAAIFLQKMGVSPLHYHAIVASGDIARDSLARRNDPALAKLGKSYLYIGPEKDRKLLIGLDYQEVDQANAAQFVLNTGFADDESESSDHYHHLMGQALACGLPMICVNPDYEVMRGAKIIPCAGALARDYEQMGGQVIWYGKPYPVAYEYVLQRLPGIKRSRIACIGDTLRTDIQGGRNAHLYTILIAGGIHARELKTRFGVLPDPRHLESLCEEEGIAPHAVMPSLTL